MQEITIIGAGFSGAVIARELAEAGIAVAVFDSRSHVAGNCLSERDADTGVMIHKYGPHIFHTDNERVWQYLNRYTRFMPYTNRVKTPAGAFQLRRQLLRPPAPGHAGAWLLPIPVFFAAPI